MFATKNSSSHRFDQVQVGRKSYSIANNNTQSNWHQNAMFVIFTSNYLQNKKKKNR